MASSSQIEAGRAFVRLMLRNDMASQLRRALQSAGSKLQSFGQRSTMAGAKLAGAAAGMLAPFGLAIKAASDLQETTAKFNTVFGDRAADMDKWANNLANSVGRGKKDILDYLGATQDLLVPLGVASDTAEDMSKNVAQLAIDLASFNNMAEADVIRDLQAALTGSSATMKKYGVLVNVAAVKQELLNQGLEYGAATEAQKAQARLNIIMRGTTAAQGDAIRTSGSFANQMKALRARIGDLAEEVGGALLPYVTQMVSAIRKTVTAVTSWIGQNKGLVVAVAAIGAAIGAAGAALFTFGVATLGIGSALSALGAAVGILLSPIGLITAAVAAAGVAFVRWTETGRQAYQFLAGNFQKLWAWVSEVFAGIRNAMLAGDMQLAAEIMWAGIQVAFTKGVSWVRQQWADLRFYLVDVWSKASFAILDTLNDLWSGMIDGFWIVADQIVDAWKWAEKSLAKGIAYVIAKLEGLDPEQVMATVEEDYGRQQAGRDAGRASRDRANRQAEGERRRAIDQARQDVMAAEASRREGAAADADKALIDARERLATALRKSEALESGEPDAAPGGIGAAPFDMPSTGGASRGVGLAATYSAAAARISGYQVSGPEQKMVDGIQQVAKNTQDLARLQEEFLAGWRVA